MSWHAELKEGGTTTPNPQRPISRFLDTVDPGSEAGVTTCGAILNRYQLNEIQDTFTPLDILDGHVLLF